MDDAPDQGLDPAAARALAEWGAHRGHRYEFVKIYTSGRSSAFVAAVLDHDNVGHGSRAVVLKHDRVPVEPGRGDPDYTGTEHMRHRLAYRDAPADFRRHLAEPLDEGPVRVGDSTWIVFQKVAGSLYRHDSLASLREADDPTAFARGCREVVHGMLTGWVQQPKVESTTAAALLGRGLRARFAPGGPLQRAAAQYREETIRFADEQVALANPFALVRGTAPASERPVRIATGVVHGDLHMENVLLPTTPCIEVPDYVLIDLAKSVSEGSLAHDPLHLLLHLAARTLGELSPAARSALLAVMRDGPLGATERALGELPGWLRQTVEAVEPTVDTWLGRFGVDFVWPAQRLLALVEHALTLYGRSSTRPEDRAWFLWLAASAADRYARLDEETPRPGRSGLPRDTAPPAVLAQTPAAPRRGVPNRAAPAPHLDQAPALDPVRPDLVPSGAGATGAWVAALCADLPHILDAATRADENTIADLCRAALRAEDRTADYAALVRRLGGPELDPRLGLPGLTDAAGPGESYVCPLPLACDRRERRTPGIRRPVCHLSADDQPSGGSAGGPMALERGRR
ncbi:hypothetical protein [Streptacidiphilus jiangxiensis]|uniref:Phosphotransferase enzyme family protein n=1 Tax=Streptacidiphilus jiangxiensis TaxID=235985 RepID=A0A1H7WHR3_STRJI|nr:hypothetical protein [Streptacidiphilus jiangxiensis]SEM21021.1 hypothetical protein SAMN05414137_120169 [Streptacidiphilus jiangxiensis]